MSKKYQIIVLLISGIVMLGFFQNRFASKDDVALQTAIKNGAFLVDVRTPSEFAGGSVKGAVNIPLDRIPYELNKFKNKTDVIVFCRSGSRSSQAKAYLDHNGIKNVWNGGTWQDVQSMFKQQ
jgi:phage shock protein E